MAKGQKVTVDGVTYNSRLESELALFFIQRGISFEYETQQYDYVVKESHKFCRACGSNDIRSGHKYTPDFFLPNGVVIEVKGQFKAFDRKKHKAMKEQHPNLDLRLVFGYNNWLNKSRKNRYSDWCDSKEIPYHVGVYLPTSWYT